MNRKLRSFFIVPLLLTLAAAGQNEAYNWYFGSYAGLSFSTSPPTVLSNGMMATYEGCSSISAPGGALLFYTDGITVWNKNHAIMTNGAGLFGDPSSTQSAIIVRKPGSSSIYYIFTMGTTGSNGLHYSTVDMTQSGGLGSVTVLNTPVYTGMCTEKLTAARHANCTDIWILTHDYSSNNFRANLVTATSVSTGGTVTAIGTVHTDAVGCMKVSPDSKRIGMAMSNSPNTVELYEFDNATGVVSNSLILTTAGVPYGVEFSPNGRYLYSVVWSGDYLAQFDVCAGDNAAILASQYTMAVANAYYSSMQLGPDGRIYIAKMSSPDLAVINNPNVSGAGCNFVSNAIALNPGTSEYGLPNYFFAARPPVPGPFSYSLGCGTVSFTAPPVLGNYSIHACSATGNSVTSLAWIFGDPSSGAANTAFGSNVTHNFATPGTYTVKLAVNYSCGGGTDSIISAVTVSMSTLPLSVSGNFSICSGNSLTLTASGATTYSWNTGSQSATLAVSPQSNSQYVVHGFGPQGTCHTYSIVSVTVSKCTGVEEIAGRAMVVAYPNPAHGRITISCERSMTLRLTDITGKLLLEKSVQAGDHAIDLSAFQSGFYFVEASYENARTVLRIENINQ